MTEKTSASALDGAQLLATLRGTISALVRVESQPDLSLRQMAVLLAVYEEAEAQTVRGLAAALNVSKPAITRALDRLGDLDLVKRSIDPDDRRSVLVRRTLAGTAYVRQLRGQLLLAASKASER